MKTAAYDGRRDLPRLLPITPRQIAGGLLTDDRAIIALLGAAVSREGRRGAEGTWTYDVARHRLLLAAYAQELEHWQKRSCIGLGAKP